MGPQVIDVVEAAIGLLKQHSGFAAITDSQLAALVAESPIDDLRIGDVAFRQGEAGSCAYLVLAGELAVEVETQWGEVRVAVMAAGDLVGEVAAFATIPRTATVFALTEAKALRLEQRTIRRLLAEHPAAAMAVIGDLGEKLRALNNTIATLIEAASALADGEFRPAMLEAMKGQADRHSHFADVFETMADEITRKRSFNREMQVAAEIQRSLLPKDLAPGHAGRCRIHASMTPARQIGGDFYDYFMIDDDRLGFAIGDVSGKGVPAAIFMSLSRTILKTVASEGCPPGEALTRVNKLLIEEGGDSMFVTLFYGCLDLRTRQITFSSAGHDDVYVLRAAEAPERLLSLGPAAGLLDGAGYPTATRALGAGDVVFLATDGVTEAFNTEGDMFGRERLEAVLGGSGRDGVEALVGAVTRAVAAFAAGTAQSDDITCVAVGVGG